MAVRRPAVVGVGATGAVLAAALAETAPDAVCVVSRPETAEALRRDGIRVSGAVEKRVRVRNVAVGVAELARHGPDAVFLCTKTYSLPRVLSELAAVLPAGVPVVSCQNGLGTEDDVAEAFGKANAFRMVLNYGCARQGPGEVRVAFFNPPNHLGPVLPEGADVARELAERLSGGGLATEAVEDVGRFVWRKMVMKCTMASICALADLTLREALTLPASRRVADACFREVLAVARALGYDLGEEYLSQAVAYLEKAGVHKDSMCHDLEAGRPTEIEYLGGRVVAYAERLGIPVPHYATLTDMVRALEAKRLGGA
ncbi:ketopantoate reductase family protein [Deferrisoma camini]|uniref:ketopantoate reductase family protein n=1 Tax=Deferrisoma camini TaxID=1035120 RepID=UPI00046D16B0|nr:2-dehydropantoate 2-reductase [Deferrisoma camini]